MAGRPIDEKIVAMKMDNSDFKRKAMETTGLFGKLQQTFSRVTGVNSLNKVTDSLGGINNAAQRVNLDSISNNVEKIAGRFSNMGVVATTALANIANKAVNVGLQVVKSMTIDPIMDGFREYETKMSSIQTILANTQSKGTTLKDVKAALSELNTYADKTIYSFSDMTRNIGLFTNAGLGLKESTSMIKGFSNAAAASGTNAEQAANAAYQLSQGLSAGYIMTQDWMSLTNAGMGNDNMKRDLIAIGQGMGTLSKKTGVTTHTLKNWKDSLSKGKWLTTNVMSTYLQAMTGDMSKAEMMSKGLTKAQAELLMQNAKTGLESATYIRTFTQMMGSLKESIGSGWATTFELIFGDFNAATKMWTGLAKAIGGFFAIFDNARNKLVGKMATAGIFTGIFEIITNGATAVLKIFKAIGAGFKNAFSGGHVGILKAIGNGLHSFADALTPSEKTLKNITIIVQALLSPIALIVRALIGLGKILFAVVAVPIKIVAFLLKELISGFLKAAAFVGKLVIAFTDGVKSGKDLSKSLGGLKGIFSSMGSAIGKVAKHISTFANAIKEAWSIIATGKFSGVGPWAEDSKIVGKLFKIRDAVFNFCSGVVEAWNIIGKGTFSGRGPWDRDDKIVGKLFAIRKAVWDFCSGVVEAWNIMVLGKNTGKGPWDKNAEIVGKLFAIRKGVQDFANGVIEAWNIIAKGDFTGIGPWEEDSKIVDKLFDIREGVLEFAHGVAEAWNILAKGKFTGIGPWAEHSAIVERLFRMRDAVKDFGNAVKEVFSVLFKGDFINVGPWSEDSPMIKALLKIREGFQSLGKFVTSMDWSLLLVPIMGAFSILGDFLSSLDFGVVLLPIAKGFAYIADKVSGMNVSLTPVANAFGAFFDMLKGGFDWVVDKLSGVGKAIKDAMPSGQKLFAGGFIAGMVGIVGMALKMAWDLQQMFKGWGNMGKGVSEVLESTAGALDGFSRQMTANAIATTLMAVAISLGILSVSLLILSRIKPEKFAPTLTALVTSLTALIGALTIMSKYDITGTGMKTAVQLVALSVAFLILSSALRKISDLGWEEISKGLYGLGITMAVFAGAVTLMGRFGGPKLGISALQMLALAGTVYLLVLVIKKIADVKTEDLKKGMAGLAVTLGIFGGIVLAMTRFGGGKMATSALQFIALAGSILIIVEAIRQISDIPTDNLVVGLKTIGVILAAIAAFSIITSNAGLLTSGIGVTLLAIALNLLLIPVLAFGSMPLVTLAKGLGALAIALLAIGAASMLMTGMVASGAGLILLAIGMNMLMIPIAAFAAMPLKALAIGIGALAIGILAIGGAAALLGLAGPALLIGAAGIAALGLAMLMAGAGLALFSTGLVTLATMTGAAVTTIVAFLGTLIVGLASLIPSAVRFVWSLIQQMATALRDNAPQLATTMFQALERMLAVIAEHVPKFVTAATNIITNFLDSLAANLPRIVESATNLMVTFIEALAAAVQTNGPRFVAAVTSLMAEIMIIFVQTGATVIEALFGWIPGVTAATQEIGNSAEQTIRDAFDAQGAGQEKGTEFANALGGKSGEAQSAGNKVGAAGKSGADSTSLTDVGAEKGTQFANALGEKAGMANAEGKDMANSGKTGADSVSLTGAGAGAGSEFANALGGKAGASKTAGQNVGNSGKAGADGVSLTGAGSGAGIEFANALSGKSGSARTSGVNLANGGKSGAGSVDMSTTGSNFGEGFANGISGAYNSVYSSAKSLAISAKNAVAKWIDSHSPSRDAHKLGGFFGIGFSNGIGERAKDVASSAKNIALAAKESLNQFMDGFELPEEDNELHFKAVVDYDALDVSRFGNLSSLGVVPNVSTTASLASSIPRRNDAVVSDSGQNGNTSALINQQDQQIGLLQEQNKLLYNIANKDNAVYLDGKAIYDNNKSIQNNQATLRNLFKGVNPA